MLAFYKRVGWQTELMNLLLDKQEWCSRQLSTVVRSLPRLRLPEMPTPSGQQTVKATGVPSNHQSPSLWQSTLAQVARSPPVAAAITRGKTGQQLQMLNLMIIEIPFPKIPILKMGSWLPGNDQKNLPGHLLWIL